MKNWIKPNGIKVTTNEMPETIEQAIKLGWKPEEVEEPKVKEVEKPEPVKSRISKV